MLRKTVPNMSCGDWNAVLDWTGVLFDRDIPDVIFYCPGRTGIG